MEPAEAVLQFLRSVGPSTEAEFYLGLFRSRPRQSFASLVVDQEAMRHNADGVALDLRLLHALALTPTVVLGFDAPEQAAAQTAQLSGLLAAAGVPTASHPLEGELEAIAADADAGRVPLVSAGASLPASAPAQLAGLLDRLQSHKLIILRQRGGMRLLGKRLSVVNMATDYDALREHAELDSQDRQLLKETQDLLFGRVRHRLLVSVTSPLNLLHELFTVKGAGTLLRAGARILAAASYAELDHERLDQLLRSSFGRPVKPEFYARPLARAFVEEGYRGTALVESCPLGGYLTKFAVGREAQGEGIGQDLWNALCAEFDSLLWRARPDNPIRAWYERICEGRLEAAGWTVYLRGVATERVPEAVAFAIAQPADFG